MERRISRRDFFGVAGMAGLVFSQRLADQQKGAVAPLSVAQRLRVAHLTDFHWGYRGEWNRDVSGTALEALERVKRLAPPADLVVVTGDLIHATASAGERKDRLQTVRQLLDSLNLPWMAVPGEHDTFGDGGAAFASTIGPLRFRRKFHGVTVFGLDNVSRGPFLGFDQIRWLQAQSAQLDASAPALVLSHAPLFDLFEPWNWCTFDGRQAYSLLPQARFLFGHIHQALEHKRGRAINDAGMPTSWPLPEPGPLVRLQPWPQGGTHPAMGLGFSVLDISPGTMRLARVPLDQARDKEAHS